MINSSITLEEKRHFEQLSLATRSHALDRDRLIELSNYIPNLRLSIQENKPLVKPLAGAIAINLGCNSKCAYCTICDKPIENTPIKDLKYAVDELNRLGVFNMGIAGGEPLLHPDLPELIAHIGKYQLYSYLHTNGTLCRSPRISAVIDAGLNALVLSLDTIDPAIYFRQRGIPIDSVITGLDYVLGEREKYSNLKIMVNCVISKINLDYIVPLVEWCNARHISIGFQPIHPDFWSHKEVNSFTFRENDLLSIQQTIDQILEMKYKGYAINNNAAYLQGFPDYLVYRRLPKGMTCNSGFTVVQIDHQLNVKSCWYMRSLGNLREQQIDEIWYSEVYARRRADMLNLNCPKCWMRRHTEIRSEQWLEEFIANIVNNNTLCK